MPEDIRNATNSTHAIACRLVVCDWDRPTRWARLNTCRALKNPSMMSSSVRQKWSTKKKQTKIKKVGKAPKTPDENKVLRAAGNEAGPRNAEQEENIYADDYKR